MPAAVVIMAIWWLVARSSGQGWVQALGELVFGGLVVGVAGPFFVIRRARVSVLSCPGDATTGQPVELELERSGAWRIGVVGGPAGVCDNVTWVPSRRGVYDRLHVEMATAAPFGLQWWKRTVAVDLPRTVYVAPALGPSRASRAGDGDAEAGAHARRSADGDLRAARPYVAGDARNTVHWPATAHTGVLMVRDLESSSAPTPEVTVFLPADPDEAEREAGKALAEILRLIGAGCSVMLITEEADGRRAGWVTDPRRARRRMAAAR
jgi:uncharacterized protein (DUF58 family)